MAGERFARFREQHNPVPKFRKNRLDLREAGLPPEEPLTRAKLIELSIKRPTLPKDPTEAIQNILNKARERKDVITREEMFQFINGVVSGAVTTEETIKWLKAVHKNGLTKRETLNLTLAMAASGKILDLSEFGNVPIADKHSTGGIGDKTSLVVGPIVAACDVLVGKMSGKGLGPTGGTIDKMDALGLNSTLSAAEFTRQLRDIGIVIAGQSDDLAPADGILYDLRDKTKTIDSIPLIAASIMSKKIASGANTLVLDVKYGNGAFMKTQEEARVLARTMVEIGKAIGITCAAELSDMNQPLGEAVGNALEVREAIDTLKGGGPEDFREHCIKTAAEIIMLAREREGKLITYGEAEALVKAQIYNGKALQKFGQMIEAQGGNPAILGHPEQLPQARFMHDIVADRDGYIVGIDTESIGWTSKDLGARRPAKDEPVEDLSAGILASCKIGIVHKGDHLFTIFTNDETRIKAAEDTLRKTITYGRRAPNTAPLEHAIIR